MQSIFQYLPLSYFLLCLTHEAFQHNKIHKKGTNKIPEMMIFRKKEDIRRYESNRQYAGNAATDQRIDFVLRQSDVDYMNQHNELVRKENNKLAAKKEAKKELAAERKSTGKSKKTYRAEYDQLMSEYKSTGNRELYLQAKSIAKYAF